MRVYVKPGEILSPQFSAAAIAGAYLIPFARWISGGFGDLSSKLVNPQFATISSVPNHNQSPVGLKPPNEVTRLYGTY